MQGDFGTSLMMAFAFVGAAVAQFLCRAAGCMCRTCLPEPDIRLKFWELKIVGHLGLLGHLGDMEHLEHTEHFGGSRGTRGAMSCNSMGKLFCLGLEAAKSALNPEAPQQNREAFRAQAAEAKPQPLNPKP